MKAYGGNGAIVLSIHKFKAIRKGQLVAPVTLSRKMSGVHLIGG